MLENLTHESFARHADSTFALRGATPAPLALRLAQVRSLGVPARAGGRQPFALLFVGPGEPVLPQRIYALEHAEMGTFEIFLVPIGRDGDGTRYEAIFT
jgi:hypothetical protein